MLPWDCVCYCSQLAAGDGAYQNNSILHRSTIISTSQHICHSQCQQQSHESSKLTHSEALLVEFILAQFINIVLISQWYILSTWNSLHDKDTTSLMGQCAVNSLPCHVQMLTETSNIESPLHSIHAGSFILSRH